MLLVLAESFVVSPPSGVTIKTRLRPTPAEEQALREVGTFLGPLYRDDDCAVSYFLRTLRERARPWASSYPWLSRVTRSARYNDPRNVPTSRSACSSAGVGRRRVLIVTPDGGETTNDSASTRSMGYT